MGLVIVYLDMAGFKPPEIEIEFNVSAGGAMENPPGRFPSTILVRRKMGRSAQVYQRYVEPHEFLSSMETAKVLRMSLRHVYRIIDAGLLKPKRVNDRLFFVSRDVQKLARKRGVHPVRENPGLQKKIRQARQKGLLVVDDENGVPWLVG